MTNILGVRVDDITESQILHKVVGWIKNGKSHYIVTTGPEFLLTAQEDEEFREIINSSGLSIPEGFGLQLYCGVKNRIPGTDLLIRLCQEAAKNGWTVGFLGGEEGIAEKTKERLQKQFPGLKVVFALDGEEADLIIGHVYSSQFTVHSKPTTVNRQLLSCDLLFVALGHPKQEKLLHKLSTDYSLQSTVNKKSVVSGQSTVVKFRVGMGVGGAFNYISGNLPRAPQWIRDIGLEWMYRIVSERPGRRLQRVRRIWSATIIFPLVILENRLIKKVS